MDLDLPGDVIIDILLRLPIKSLLRFQYVSKEWLSLISSIEFGKWLLKPPYLKQRILLPDHSNNLISFNCQESRNFGDVSTCQLLKKPSFLSMDSIVVGSCDGLLCISDTSFNTIHLWNPSTGEYRRIPSLRLGRKEWVIGYGFGYDTKRDDYKVVVFVTAREQNGESIIKIFSLRDETWRSSQNTTTNKCLVSGDPHLAVYLDGALYWVGKRNANSTEYLIVSFSLEDETVKLIQVPDSECGFCPSLAVINGHLFFTVAITKLDINSVHIRTNLVHTWKMHQYELDLSSIKRSYFSKRCGLALFGTYPLYFTTQSEIVFGFRFESFVSNLRRLVIWNDRTDTARKLKIGTAVMPTIYVETLASPNAYSKKRKRKRSS